MLGKGASADAVEDQALAMLDWDDSLVNETLQRVASHSKKAMVGDLVLSMGEDEDMMGMDEDEDMYGMDEDDAMYGMDEDMDEPFGMDEDMEEGMGWGGRSASVEDRMLSQMLREAKGGKSSDTTTTGFNARSRRAAARRNKREQTREASVEDRMLSHMLSEDRRSRRRAAEDVSDKPAGRRASKEERMLAEMLRSAAEEGEEEANEEVDEKDEKADEKADEKDDEKAEKEASYGDLDPMGLLDEDVDPGQVLTAAEEEALQDVLYGNDTMRAARLIQAEDDEEEEEEEEDEEEEEEEEEEEKEEKEEKADKKANRRSRTASRQRPRPRKQKRVASPDRLGNLSGGDGKGLSDYDKAQQISQFWNAPPDVNDHFGVPSVELDYDFGG
jgi:hypothetical protein